MLLLLIPPCTFWPAGPLLGVSPLNRASRPPAADVAPPPENLVIYGVFCSSKKNGIDREKKTWGPPCYNIAPRWAKMSPEMAQLRPNMAPRCPKIAQHGPNMAPRWPNIGPRWPNIAPRWPNMTPRWLNIAPRWPNIAPRWPNLAPN